MTLHMRLGRVQEHDPRSLAFPAPTSTPVVTKRWGRYGQVLDQGNVGSCTGNAAAGAINHTPFHVVGRTLHEPDALSLYSEATVLDGFPGTYPPDDTGSSGLAVAKAAVLKGYISGYTHAFGLDHLLSALMTGPLICGTNWHEDMFNPDPKGLIRPTGSVAGGHEYVCDGVNVSNQILRFQNSWSASWGARGRFYMTFSDFSALLNEGGDAVLFNL